MKLAEALILRADYQKRIEQLKNRLLRNAKVQEGDTPAEDPQRLLQELDRVTGEQLALIQRINRTNAVSKLENGQTLSDALAVRDMLKTRHSIYRDLAETGTVTLSRFTKSEVRFQSTVPVADLQKTADNLALEHRELDTRIQAANWQAEIVE